MNWLRGPRPLNGQDISFLNDRFRDGKTYLPFTYFAGSTPDNNYTPAQPYKVTIESNHVSAEEQGYMKLFIPCGGADSPRPIKLRQRELLSDALEKLEDREREIITLRFGLDGRPERTQKEVADRLGISQSYISRLEKRIIRRLRREILRVSQVP